MGGQYFESAIIFQKTRNTLSFGGRFSVFFSSALVESALSATRRHFSSSIFEEVAKISLNFYFFLHLAFFVFSFPL
jgi:hypothetical protein